MSGLPVLTSVIVILAAGAVHGACPPDGVSREALLTLKQSGFKISDSARRQSVAIDLLPCLAHTDPELRDRVAFEALSTWMRQRQITAQTGQVVRGFLLPQIAADFPDPQGFARPFAALALSELVRMDRIDPFMTEDQLMSIAAAAVTYLRTVSDYRGFSVVEGWRHGIAHGADLLLQLAVNPRTPKYDLDRMLDAIQPQIAPPGEHFYVYGEPQRLARAVFFLMHRKLHSAAEWNAWFERVSAPTPLQTWQDAYSTQSGLAKRHNTAAFLHALYLYVREDGAEIADSVLEPMLAAIKRLS